MRPFVLAILLGLAPALAGCVETPRPDPALDVPAAYRAARDTSAPLPRAAWWTAFRSAELTRIAEAAEAGNLDIAVAVARIRQADAQARVVGAALLPTLDLSASAARSRSADLSGRGSEGANRFGTSLAARYELDFWGRARSETEAADQLARASRFDRDTVALTATSSAAGSYMRIVAARDRKAIARLNLESATRVLTIIRERLAVGTATALDLAQQESVVASLRAEIPPLDQIIEQEIATLAVLVGRAPERLSVRGASMDALAVPRVGAGVPSALLARRPDIAAAEARLEAAHANVNAARAAFFPTISLTAAGGIESLALTSLFQPGAAFYAIGAGLAQPIFDGGRLQGQFDIQEAAQEELLQAYRAAVLNAFADVERALIAVRQLAEQERLQRESLASSRRAYDIAEQRLREGTVDLVTVLNTQTTLFQAQDALTRVRLARFLASVSLYQALGGGWTVAQGRAETAAR
ncbi:efflux transporter outer membrane subunit [Alsobacter sp. SYSU M60028]|uniref:Efflux transporter outer membrane subunit n=1 Tax=Alsobacter ponti TaxID=2962936 RepID=A0ABT1LF71_9HYPH|nr:efflux transporter outer membrane subunit [Alsobacter ponti]